MSLSFFGDEESSRRTLGIRERQILYDSAQKKCENCSRDLEFSDMQVGHKTAYSRGGNTTLRNSVSLCYGCNKKQGTDSWDVFQRKQGKTAVIDRMRNMLTELTLQKLKDLAQKHGVKLKGRFHEGGLLNYDYYQAPSKARYVKALVGVVTEKDVKSGLSAMPTPGKTKRRRTTSYWSIF